MLLSNYESYPQAIQWVTKKSTSDGNIEAQNEMGKMYYSGDGVKQDYIYKRPAGMNLLLRKGTLMRSGS